MGQVPYSASKGGVASMTLPMTRDLAQFGIRVVTIAPGLFGIYKHLFCLIFKLEWKLYSLNFLFDVLETPMFSLLSERVKQKILNQLEFPVRPGKSDGELNKLVIHIIENTYMNGEIIRIDGGIRLGKL